MKRGFTLLELLVVMVIIAVVSAISIPGFLKIGQGMALRTSTRNISANLSLARQWAITHRTNVRFLYTITTNKYSYYIIGEYNSGDTNDFSVIITSNSLPTGVKFNESLVQSGGWIDYCNNGNPPTPPPIEFNSQGGLNYPTLTPRLVTIQDINNPNSAYRTIHINWLVGSVSVEQ